MTESDLKKLIGEDTIVATLLDEELRPAFLAFLGRPSQDARSVLELAGIIAKRCRATTVQLSDVAAALETDGSDAAMELLSDFIEHPEIHADIRLAVRGRLQQR